MTRAPFCFIHSSAALVSSPPENAMPTFSPLGRLFKIVVIGGPFPVISFAVEGVGREPAQLTAAIGSAFYRKIGRQWEGRDNSVRGLLGPRRGRRVLP